MPSYTSHSSLVLRFSVFLVAGWRETLESALRQFHTHCKETSSTRHQYFFQTTPWSAFWQVFSVCIHYFHPDQTLTSTKCKHVPPYFRLGGVREPSTRFWLVVALRLRDKWKGSVWVHAQRPGKGLQAKQSESLRAQDSAIQKPDQNRNNTSHSLYNHPYTLNHIQLVNWTFHNYEVNIFKVLAIIYHRFHVKT